MSFKERNITISLINFTLIFGFFLVRVVQLLQGGTFNEANVFRLWGIVIFFAVIVTLVAIFMTHFGPGIIRAIRTGEKNPEFEYLEDERDKWIDLRGTRITYTISSLGVFFAMLTFVYGQSPLVMFTLLILFGLLAQIIGDASRLYLYRRGGV